MPVSPTAPTRPQPVLHGRLRLWSVKQIHSRVYALLFFSVYQGLVVFKSQTLIFSIIMLLLYLHPPKTPKHSINTTLVPCTQRTQLVVADGKFHRGADVCVANGFFSIHSLSCTDVCIGGRENKSSPMCMLSQFFPCTKTLSFLKVKL